MLIECKPSLYPEFSSFKYRGVFYHQTGSYNLNLDGKYLVPVNRSYSPISSGNRQNSVDNSCYKKDVLIHERAGGSAFLFPNEEMLIDVYRQKLLYLVPLNEIVWLDARQIDERVSPQAKKLLGETEEMFDRHHFSIPHQLGVFGSHRVGLNKIDSDLDVITWVCLDDRDYFVKTIINFWREMDYRTAEEAGKSDEVAFRYARRFGLPDRVGYYLANKRLRFLTPEGISVSLQCLTNIDEHRVIARFLEGIRDPWNEEEVNLECRVTMGEAAYNFPKTWRVEVKGQPFSVISFSWMHQGMGDDFRDYENYVLKAAKITNNKGTFFYLRDNSHYLIPKGLLL